MRAMAPTNAQTTPILDQPHSYDYELLPTGAITRLANQDLVCLADANSDAAEITWPWADAVYARRITLTISDWQDGPLTPLHVRCFPGHQETIAGAEGMIVTKRLVLPLKSPDDKALIFLLECQAEGDRLLKLEIDIDWGEPLSQRIVDGLLLAQRNPEPARGIYSQSNAESTRVFGNPYGRPDSVDLADPQRARLVYHVLVNGIVEVPILLTVSDVGEQVAWNGFLSLRDVEPVFDASTETWNRQLRLGRLWTPDPHFNHAVHAGKLEAMRRVQRLRSGWSPSDRRLASIGVLVDAWDAIDPTVSRNLLAHLRRLAEETDGALPPVLPAFAAPSRQHPPGPDQETGAATDATIDTIIASNAIYFAALAAHLRHHAGADLLVAHLPAIRLCAEQLIRARTGSAWQDNRHAAPAAAALAQAAQFAAAAPLAAGAQLDVEAEGVADTQAAYLADAARYESEAVYLQSCAARAAATPASSLATNQATSPLPNPIIATAATTAATAAPLPAALAAADWLSAIRSAGTAVWDGCGITWRDGELWVEPTWPRTGWWALLSLPLPNGKHLSLLWDGATLHATHPIRSSLPVTLQKRIEIHGADEFDFDPYFELTRASDAGDTGGTHRFKPKFLVP
jgi:hypothetical protein